VPFRVASFNIHHGVGMDGRLDLERTAAAIRATGAAVVGLQEVDRHLSARSGWADQAGWLGAELGLEVVHGPTLDLDPHEPSVPDAPRRRYGNAILSAHPIHTWQALALPSGGRREPRGVVTAVVEVGGTPLRVAVTHLQVRSRSERLSQAARIVELLADTGSEPVGRRAPRVLPRVLLGDLNASPDSPEIGLLTTRLVDAWAAAGDGPGFTFDAATPHARIDYVMTSPDLVAAAAWLVPTHASDHYPVVADLPDLPSFTG
jgi:endonuclease/exonuclease/phosphatase family metal-dependent hydrolase